MSLEEDVKELIVLRDAAKNLAEADNIADLTAALEKAAPLAAKYKQAEQLRKDISSRRRELIKMREAAARKATEDADRKAAEKTEPSAPTNPGS